MQSLFDFREGVSMRVAKPDNRKVEAATELEDAKEVELAAKALLAHNKAQILCEKQRALPNITCFVTTGQITHPSAEVCMCKTVALHLTQRASYVGP
jgi:hypothetical protein